MTGTDPLRLDYEALPGLHDEMLVETGRPRSPWDPLVQSLHAMGRSGLTRRWEAARRLIQENGVTYNVYGDPRGMDRPWKLDPIPLVSSEAEWKPVRAALAQRARLLDAILADLYGPQRLLREGLLPAELVFAHPSYLRPCHGAHHFQRRRRQKGVGDARPFHQRQGLLRVEAPERRHNFRLDPLDVQWRVQRRHRAFPVRERKKYPDPFSRRGAEAQRR
jgi:hypothetical protein